MKTNNALVTYTDLTTMGLIAIGTPPTGNHIATKAFIISSYVVDPSLLVNYMELQCPPYQYIVPSCYIVQGYVDGADLNASYNFEVCFDWYDCSGVLVSYCTIGEGGFTLINDCYNPAYGIPVAYYYEYPGGPKVIACCSYIDGINICGGGSTTTTTTTSPPPPPPGTDYVTAVVFGGQIVRSTDGGATWTGLTAPGSRNWNSVAMSTGGQYQLAADGAGTRWRSTDYGANWTQDTGSPNVPPGEVGVSGTGQYQLAVPVSNQNLYIAVSNDYGVNWTNRITAGQDYWGTGAISKTGQYMIVGTDLYYSGINSVKVSSNYGVNFSTIAGQISSEENPFSCSAISGTGQYMLVGSRGYTARMWRSSNFGVSFTYLSGSPIPTFASAWSIAAISSTGQYMLVGENVGYLYSSSDYGVSWTMLTSLNQRQWSNGSISTTGQYQYVTVYGGSIWFSNDYGVNWTTLNSAGQFNNWTGIATSR